MGAFNYHQQIHGRIKEKTYHSASAYFTVNCSLIIIWQTNSIRMTMSSLPLGAIEKLTVLCALERITLRTDGCITFKERINEDDYIYFRKSLYVSFSLLPKSYKVYHGQKLPSRISPLVLGCVPATDGKDRTGPPNSAWFDPIRLSCFSQAWSKRSPRFNQLKFGTGPFNRLIFCIGKLRSVKFLDRIEKMRRLKVLFVVQIHDFKHLARRDKSSCWMCRNWVPGLSFDDL